MKISQTRRQWQGMWLHGTGRHGLTAYAAAFAALLLWTGPEALAIDQQEDPAGPIVQIGPDPGSAEDEAADNGEGDLEQPTPRAGDQRDGVTPNLGEEPQYWVGIQGRTIESPVLRTHLQLAEDLGIVVERVVADSPADQAGLREHDVVIRANGQPVQNMIGLQQIIRAAGDQPVELRVIRLAKEIEINVTPAAMPEEIRRRAEEFERLGLPEGNPANVLDGLLGGRLGELRGFDQSFRALPNGISVRITRDAQGRPQITVRQGEKNWTLNRADAAALEQLPEQIRPLIERMLEGRGWGEQPGAERFDRRFDLDDQPGDLFRERFEGFGAPQRRDAREEDDVLKRMEQLERRLEELQQRLEEDDRQ